MLKNQIQKVECCKSKERKIVLLDKDSSRTSLKNFIHVEIQKHFQEIRIISWVNSLCMMLSYQQNNMEGLYFSFKTSVLVEKHIDHIFRDSIKQAHNKWKEWLKKNGKISELTNSDIYMLQDELIYKSAKGAREIVNEAIRNPKKCEDDISRIYPRLFFKKEESMAGNFQRILEDFYPKATSFEFKPF